MISQGVVMGPAIKANQMSSTFTRHCLKRDLLPTVEDKRLGDKRRRCHLREASSVKRQSYIRDLLRARAFGSPLCYLPCHFGSFAFQFLDTFHPGNLLQ
ncbi:hypothetical protein NDU88_001857 [Pleurodeles waltl]|uniref:Uncharacterized protein n=1 Tax=Pleurodeles waltl TaxID=8319 RepID=A0AAV7NLE5_PLEWA|nr:hypothetical protein NDU88_001857 [Pleurodeles waltl]